MIIYMRDFDEERDDTSDDDEDQDACMQASIDDCLQAFNRLLLSVHPKKVSYRQGTASMSSCFPLNNKEMIVDVPRMNNNLQLSSNNVW